jgi:predicted ribosome quality control (RQC) complex YloA/Tae2 family protein
MVKIYIFEENDDTKINICVGESAQDNFDIISNAEQNYYWLHVDNLPSAHVIIFHNNPSKRCINYAAKLCLLSTKYVQGNVIYTNIKNIQKLDNGSVHVKKKLGIVKFK